MGAPVVGVDGCKAGWMAVELVDGAFAGARVFRTIVDVSTAFADAAAIGVDIPIGLVDKGRRQADVAAREFLGRQRSSVFFSPPRLVLDHGSYVDANVALRAGGHAGVSQQTWALVPKIREVEAAAASDARIFEVHPECSFKALWETSGIPAASGRRLASKKSWNGVMQRWEALRAAGIAIPADAGPAGDVPATDDLLDAAAAAWSAARHAARRSISLPDPPEALARRDVAIWY